MQKIIKEVTPRLLEWLRIEKERRKLSKRRSDDLFLIFAVGKECANFMRHLHSHGRLYLLVDLLSVRANEVLALEPSGIFIPHGRRNDIDPEILDLGIPIIAVGDGCVPIAKMLNMPEPLMFPPALQKPALVDYIDERSRLFIGCELKKYGAQVLQLGSTKGVKAFVFETAWAEKSDGAIAFEAGYLFGLYFDPLSDHSTLGEIVLYNFIFIICHKHVPEPKLLTFPSGQLDSKLVA